MSERPIIIEEGMEVKKTERPIVLKCIDFRTTLDTTRWLSDKGIDEGSYYLYASAGASGNPDGFLKEVKTHNHSLVIAVDHQDCGFYKQAGDDSPQTHHHNLEILGQTIHEENPNLTYTYHLLPVDDKRHTCEATAIILGQPPMVKLARQKMAELGLSANYDEIARPYALSVDDKSLWDDLKISLSLHHPKKIFLFENDEEHARRIMGKIKEVAKHVDIEQVILETAA